MSITNESTPRMAAVVPTTGALTPLTLDAIDLGGYWAERQDTVRRVTLRHIASWLEREGWIGNFDLAASGDLSGRRGREFADSEIYKFLEAACWDLGTHPDEELENIVQDFTRRVAAAQQDDGYVGTAFGREGQEPRWSDLEWGHELYCLGHLFQAAVARHRTHPGESGGLVDISRRAADLVCGVFGDGGIESVCGHAEIEPAMLELGRALDEPRYVAMATTFIARRGLQTLPDIEFGRDYYQDDMPIREADALRGHAVRANYLSAGAVDVAIENGDDELLAALEKQWDRTVTRRTYLTGGQGSRHAGEEFGDDFELPPDRAYSETCAGIGSVMFSWRLLLATGDEKYADLIERTLFNVVSTGLAASGDAFFYTNTLHKRTMTTEVIADQINPRADSALRAPWFEVSCCPPNIARTIASIQGLLATTDDKGVQIHQFAPATVRAQVAGGDVVLRLETQYPAAGSVRITVDSAPDGEWTLSARVPCWAAGATARVVASGSTEDLATEPGRLDVTRRWAAGDALELELPFEPRIVHPDPRIDAVRGAVAVERGPSVLCVESVDLPSGDVNAVEFAPELKIALNGDQVVARLVRRNDVRDGWPYGDSTEVEIEDLGDVALIPYRDWGNRGPSTMRVWVPVGA